MRKTIDGIEYDTDKAREIGQYSNLGKNVSSWTDDEFWGAGLYQTPEDRYFIAGQGGRASRFGRACEHVAWVGGCKTEPVSRKQAYTWAKNYLSQEIVEREFSDMIAEA